jgi:phosphoenolpyruvate synthase/pyruvate phosphate dikinase
MNTEDVKYLMNWDEAFKSTTAEVGGKGYNLARLQRYGFQVPAGGVLTSRVYWHFLEWNGLSDTIHAAASIKDVLDNAVEKLFTEIREKISNGQLPEIYIQELSKQLTSLKFVDKPVAVVIMELIPAEAAGVALSCDPLTGRRDRIVITANFGLGESVVCGIIEPDEYVLHSISTLPEIISRKIGGNKKYTRLKPESGTELVSTDEETKNMQVMEEGRIIELGMLIRHPSENTRLTAMKERYIVLNRRENENFTDTAGESPENDRWRGCFYL